MKRVLNFICGAAAMAAASIVATAPASAQAWPTQRVTVVVPFGAGSVTDILARIFAEEMGRRWGQQVIVENRPGLAGTAAVAKAVPDGYTLMVTSNGHTVSGLVTKDAPFDPVKDFAGITRLGSAPLFLIAYPEVPVKTVKEVIELAKKEPGKLNFSSPGLASTTFIAGAQFRRIAGINIVHVPFRSAPDAVTARNPAQVIGQEHAVKLNEIQLRRLANLRDRFVAFPDEDAHASDTRRCGVRELPPRRSRHPARRLRREVQADVGRAQLAGQTHVLSPRQAADLDLRHDRSSRSASSGFSERRRLSPTRNAL